MSRAGAVTFKGNPMTLAGQEVQVGQPAPDFKLHYFQDGLKTIGPADLDLKEGTGNVVYAWGSAEDKNLALATQTFGGMETTPQAVHAGGNGAAVSANSSGEWMAWAAAGGTVALSLLVARRFSGRRV